MPLKRLLDENRSFDPQAVSVLLTAYEGVVAELRLIDPQEAELRLIDPQEKERAAKLVLQIARDQTNLDAAKLRSAVAASILNKGGSPIA